MPLCAKGLVHFLVVTVVRKLTVSNCMTLLGLWCELGSSLVASTPTTYQTHSRNKRETWFGKQNRLAVTKNKWITWVLHEQEKSFPLFRMGISWRLCSLLRTSFHDDDYCTRKTAKNLDRRKSVGVVENESRATYPAMTYVLVCIVAFFRKSIFGPLLVSLL